MGDLFAREKVSSTGTLLISWDEKEAEIFYDFVKQFNMLTFNNYTPKHTRFAIS